MHILVSPSMVLKLSLLPSQVFGHDSFDPRHGHTTENLHQTFLKTLQGEALPSLIESMMGHLQDVMLKSDKLSPSKDHWDVDGIFAFCYKVSNLTLDLKHKRSLRHCKR